MKTRPEILLKAREMVNNKQQLAFGDPRRDVLQARIDILTWVLDLTQIDPAVLLEKDTRNFLTGRW